MNNIINRVWKQNSMVNIEDLRGMTFQAEEAGHTFQIRGMDGNGDQIALSGTPAGILLRADHQDVTLDCSVSDGIVYATLPANAYVVSGRFGITIFLTSGGQKTAIYAAIGSVSRTSSGTVAPPAGSNVVDLVNAIQDAIALIPSSDTNLKAAMAPTYSTSAAYAVGSYAWYNGQLYRCTTAITSGETWTSGHWTLADMGEDVADLKDAVNDIYDNSFYPGMTDGKMIEYSTGNAANNSESACTDHIYVVPGTKVRLKNVFLSGTRGVCWYRKNGYGGYLAYGTSDTDVLVTIPSEAVTIRATAKVNEAVQVVVTGEVNLRLSDLEQRMDAEENKSTGLIPLGFNWSKYQKPNGFTASIPFTIFSDNHNFITDYNYDNFKNTGGATWYVTQTASTSKDGTTRADATSFSKAYTNASDGDTIILLEGDYDRDTLTWGNTIIQKNINIVGEGMCRIFAGQLNMTFTKSDGYDYVYQTTRSNAKNVINYKAIKEKYICYELKTSVAEVDASEGSFYISGSTVYVHDIGDGNPSANVCVTVLSEKWMEVNNANQNTKVTFQNIVIVGNEYGIRENKTNTGNSLEVIYDHVKSYFGGNKDNDSFMVYGGTAIFNKCEAVYSFKDGFNYNGTNRSGTTTDCFGIEIDCIGSSCGLRQTGESQNGTTGHAGAKMLRVNGLYYDNFGANVADVQSGTMSINLGCKAFYSAGTPSGANENFAAQQSGATMWLNGCAGVGATKDISCVTGATMYLDHCTYKEKAGGGTIEEEKTIPFDIYTLYKLSELI